MLDNGCWFDHLTCTFSVSHSTKGLPDVRWLGFGVPVSHFGSQDLSSVKELLHVQRRWMSLLNHNLEIPVVNQHACTLTNIVNALKISLGKFIEFDVWEYFVFETKQPGCLRDLY